MKSLHLVAFTVFLVGVTSAAYASPKDAPESGTPLLGSSLEQAKKTDFFTFFHLAEQSSKEIGEGKKQLSFKPSGGAFKEFVDVSVQTDAKGKIYYMDLSLARSFIDDPKTAPFARDITKSLLRSSMSSKQLSPIAELVSNIEYGHIPSGGQTIIVAKDVQVPKLPYWQMDGYDTFLGKKPAFVQELPGEKTVELAFRSFDDRSTFMLMLLHSEVKKKKTK